MPPYDIEEAFRAIENELLDSMMRNLKHHRAEETKEGFEWTSWQAEQMKALNEYKRKNKKKFRKQFSDINSKIEENIRESRKLGMMDEEVSILEAIKKGFKAQKADSSLQGEFFKINQRKLDALINATIKDMNTAETAMLRMANDQYRKIIFNAQVYGNTGAGTYKQAIDMATKDFLSRGINCIEYKNGARVNIASYAAMALRTANTRAYCQGEGQKRQEWGISTVIMNKRGNPCLKCLKWCGKVLIDDVWSGGKASDGPYPLMSKAMAEGLYHPNCKDGHTTFFPGISEEPKPLTKKDVDNSVEDYRQESKIKYAQNHADRFRRLADYSLDEENKRKYGAKADEWAGKELSLEEEVKISQKREYNAMTVNREIVNSKKYHDKIEALGLNKNAQEKVYVEAKRMLEKADGSDYEYLTVVDARTGKIIVSTIDDVSAIKNRVRLSDEQYEKVIHNANSVITIHNHSKSGRPSGADILTAFRNKNVSESIIACHDGDIFVLSNFDRKYDIDKIYENYYNEHIRIRLGLPEESDIPEDVGEHIKRECKIKATNDLYDLNKKERMFTIRRI